MFEPGIEPMWCSLACNDKFKKGRDELTGVHQVEEHWSAPDHREDNPADAHASSICLNDLLRHMSTAGVAFD